MGNAGVLGEVASEQHGVVMERKGIVNYGIHGLGVGLAEGLYMYVYIYIYIYIYVFFKHIYCFKHIFWFFLSSFPPPDASCAFRALRSMLASSRQARRQATRRSARRRA